MIECLILLLSVNYGNTVSSNLGFLSGKTECGESLESLHLVGDSLHNKFVSNLHNRHDRSRCVDVGGCGISLLEDDQVLLVFVQTGDVAVKRFLASVGAAVVNTDSDGSGVSGVESSNLQFLQSESTSQTLLGRVALCLALHNGPKKLSRTGGDGGSSLGTSQTTGLFAGGLVKIDLNLKRSTRRLRVLLVEVKIGDDIVMLHHLD